VDFLERADLAVEESPGGPGGESGVRSWIAALIVASVLVTSCGSSHPSVSNGSVTVCYRAIPVAESAVHDRAASLVGVHRLAVDSVRSQLPTSASAELTAENDRVVCAVAFKGPFTAGQVEMAPGDDVGTYAVILVSSRHLHLVDSFVLDQLPKAFGKRTI
jgi:hypothetical protein